jgi:hypothetical protein
VKTRVQIFDRDRGAKALLREVRLTGAIVEVGMLGPKAAQSSAKGPSFGDVATWLEFGTPTAEARKPISGYFDAEIDANREFARKLARERLAGRVTYDRALKMLGLRAVSGIQRRMSQGLKPDNKPSTIRRKGSSKPGIDTGQTRSRYSFRIVGGAK